MQTGRAAGPSLEQTKAVQSLKARPTEAEQSWCEVWQQRNCWFWLGMKRLILEAS